MQGRRRRVRHTVLLVVGAALVAGTTALASDSVVPVNLRLGGSASPTVGQGVRLTASARLAIGNHLLIQAFRGASRPAKVVECLRSPCTGPYKATSEGHVAFQASVIKRIGTRITTLGRSKRITVSWSQPAPPPAPTPPAPPPPAATPGHFTGTIGNAQSPINFDIGGDGLSLANWSTGEIDESCDPSTYTFAFSGLHAGGPFPVAQDGSFTITGSASNLSPPLTAYSVRFTGKITGSTASEILHVESSYTIGDGTQLNCTSGDQPWTATKTG